jgi:cytochrome c oxidase assembly factor CtaG
MMLLHAEAALGPHEILRAWSFEPAVVISLSVTTALYVRGTRQMLKRSTHATLSLRRDVALFSSGLVILAVALLSPLHRAGHFLFSAHMIQHELLMTVAAPLLVLGSPGVPLIWGVPKKSRRVIGKLFSLRISPLAAFLIHASAIWIWHAPRLYDSSVTNDSIHSLQHASFLITALLFWWTIFHSRGRKASDGTAIIYLFLTAVHTTLLGALLTLSDTRFYSVYSDPTAHAWGLTAAQDQQLGGIIMWIPGGIAYLVAALLLMLKWMNESAKRAAKRDGSNTSAYLYSLR